MDANFTKSGKVYLSYSFTFTLNSDNIVSGTGVVKMNIDDDCGGSSELELTDY
jgi:hypothetical protein